MKWKEFHFGTDSFKPKPAYCRDSLADARCEALSTSSSSFWAWALENWSGKSYRAFKTLQGQTFCFCLRISVIRDLLSHPPTVTSCGRNSVSWTTCGVVQPQPTPSECLRTAGTRLAMWAGGLSSLTFPAVLRGLYRKRCCVLKLEISMQHS